MAAAAQAKRLFTRPFKNRMESRHLTDLLYRGFVTHCPSKPPSQTAYQAAQFLDLPTSSPNCDLMSLLL